MAVTRNHQRIKLSRTTANSRRAAATSPSLRPIKVGKRAPELNAAKKLQRRERRKVLKQAREALREARELAGRPLLIHLPLEIYDRIYDYLQPGPPVRNVYFFRPGEEAYRCCGCRPGTAA
jgi:hypothetical protein